MASLPSRRSICKLPMTKIKRFPHRGFRTDFVHCHRRGSRRRFAGSELSGSDPVTPDRGFHRSGSRRRCGDASIRRAVSPGFNSTCPRALPRVGDGGASDVTFAVTVPWLRTPYARCSGRSSRGLPTEARAIDPVWRGPTTAIWSEFAYKEEVETMKSNAIPPWTHSREYEVMHR